MTEITTEKVQPALLLATGSITIAPCPICAEPAGFHGVACYDYSHVSPELVGPFNSKEFMVFLHARIVREKAEAEAKAKAKLAALVS